MTSPFFYSRIAEYSAVVVGEEGGHVAEEQVGRVEAAAVLYEGGEGDVGYYIVAAVRGVSLVNPGEREYGCAICGEGAQIDSHGDVGGVTRTSGVAHLFVFVTITISSSGDIAQNRGCCGHRAGPFAKHELAVVTFSAYHNSVVFIVYTIYVS